MVTGVESFRFSPEVTAPAAARRFVADVLTRWGCAAMVDNAELLVSELVTNSVRHAATEGTLVISRNGRGVRIEATDAGPGEPGVRRPARDEPSGRGLAIVSRVAARWGVEPVRGATGKTVWFELDPT
jgi:anti-sigma regulatory factor (Ser/Thr protein kinase)